MKKILIVGAGVAGLAAGITLERAGFSCEIYEKNGMPGGNLGAWDRQGYTIDNCIHWLEGTRRGTKLYDMWEELGVFDRHTEFEKGEYFYQSTVEGKSVSLYPSIEKTRKEWLAASPEDTKEIHAFLDAVKIMRSHICRVEPFPFLPNTKIWPVLVRYGGISLEKLSRRFTSPLLRHALTDYIPDPYTALSLIWTYASYTCNNASVPKGGSRAAALRMANAFSAAGGALHLSAPVERICTVGSTVTGILLKDGSFIRGDAVICACDPAFAYGNLLPADTMPVPLSRLYKKNKYLIFSALQAAFGCDASLIPSFGTQIVEAPFLSCYKGRLILREFSGEQDFAPAGKVLIQCMIPVDAEEGERWIALREDMPAYADAKKQITKSMRQAVEAAFPQTADKLEWLDTWTPATYHRYHGCKCGAFMAFALPGGQFPLAIPSSVPEYENLFLASQWQRTPGGLPNAARAGIACAMTVARTEHKKRRFSAAVW